MGNSVCEWVQGVFSGNCIKSELNNSLLILIPKKNNPEDFSQFRLLAYVPSFTSW